MTKAFEAAEKARNKIYLIFKNNKGGDGTLFLQLPQSDKSAEEEFQQQPPISLLLSTIQTINTTARGPSLPKIF